MKAMNKHQDVEESLNTLSRDVVDCFFQVHKELGAGFPENIYEDALCIEFEFRSIPFERQRTYEISYKGKILNSVFKPDLIVNNQIIIELKAVDKIHPTHQSQIYSYLKATKLPLGFLVNFNVPLIKDGIGRYLNKNFAPSELRVNNKETA